MGAAQNMAGSQITYAAPTSRQVPLSPNEFVDTFIRKRHQAVQQTPKPKDTVVETVEKAGAVPNLEQIEIPQIQGTERLVEVPCVQVQTVEYIDEIVESVIPARDEQRAVNLIQETVRGSKEEVDVGPPSPIG